MLSFIKIIKLNWNDWSSFIKIILINKGSEAVMVYTIK